MRIVKAEKIESKIMITLHHLDQSRSFRILWALEELALNYQVKFYKRLPTFAAPPELKLVHPCQSTRVNRCRSNHCRICGDFAISARNL